MAEERVIAVQPQELLRAINGPTGLIVKLEEANREFDDLYDNLGEVAGVLEEAGINSSKVRFVCSLIIVVAAGSRNSRRRRARRVH